MDAIVQKIIYRTLNLLAGHKNLYDVVNEYESAKIMLSKKNSKAPLELSHIRFNRGNMTVLVNNNGIFAQENFEHEESTTMYFVVNAIDFFHDIDVEASSFNRLLVDKVVEKSKEFIRQTRLGEHRSFERDYTVHGNVSNNGEVSLRSINFHRVDKDNKWYFICVKETEMYDTRAGKDDVLLRYNGWNELASM